MAVEFALLAFPFFLLMMVLIETSTIFYAELVMDRAVAKVGREVRMVFRVKDYDHKRNFRRYFWKPAPLMATI